MSAESSFSAYVDEGSSGRGHGTSTLATIVAFLRRLFRSAGA
jgi:hypothetical protein